MLIGGAFDFDALGQQRLVLGLEPGGVIRVGQGEGPVVIDDGLTVLITHSVGAHKLVFVFGEAGIGLLEEPDELAACPGRATCQRHVVKQCDRGTDLVCR